MSVGNIIFRMQKFKFDAPQYFRFTLKEQLNDIVNINLEDKDDVWFLTERFPISPLKDSQQNLSRSKSKLKPPKEKQSNLKKCLPHKPNLKRDKTQPKTKLQTEAKNKPRNFIRDNRQIKKQDKKRVVFEKSKVSNTNSDTASNNMRIPCPFPIRIQKKWQAKSQKKWHSLSNESKDKAMNSMRRLRKNERKSPVKDQKRRFRF